MLHFAKVCGHYVGRYIVVKVCHPSVLAKTEVEVYEEVRDHLHLFHILNDFAGLGCYTLLHKVRGSDGDANAFDAIHLNDFVIDFCNPRAQARQSRVAVNELQGQHACF